jgi:hypothetical protein
MKAITVMRLQLGVSLVLALCCTLMAAPASAQILELNGTWQLNHDKSQGPQDQVEILTITVTPQDEHYVIHEVHANGKITDGEYRAKFDGSEYQQTSIPPAPSRDGATHYVKAKKLFDRVEEVTNVRRMPDGSSKVTGHYIRQLSPDYKTMYDTLINTDGEETAFRVFDKVSDKTTPAHGSRQ